MTPNPIPFPTDAKARRERQLKKDDTMENESEFLAELTSLINRYSRENGSNTPDFLLAEYLECQLRTWDQYVSRRERWYGREESPLNTGSLTA